MKTVLTRCVTLVGALSALVPTAVLAHDGSAGHHGWLAGALQPLLGVDHFLAALFVMGLLSVGLTALARRRDTTEVERRD